MSERTGLPAIEVPFIWLLQPLVGSSRYLFDMILDMMGRGFKEQPPLCMLFADAIVLSSSRRQEEERKLEE